MNNLVHYYNLEIMPAFTRVDQARLYNMSVTL